jgi:ribosomal protein S6|uniref:Small ribosomal subunit protein bS6c n=1 Tax=Proboscia sp. TaxID=1923967 RepID=A0A2U9NM77_9STRA|nr:ribosomal protein S6 [Proboscia sp.]
MTEKVKYEMMILLTEEFNKSELKTWSFNYARNLQLLSASQISIISKGKLDLAYPVKDQKKGNFVQINFSIIPNCIKTLKENTRFDPYILRYLLVNRGFID